MKRDLDLARKILLEIEESNKPRGFIRISVNGYAGDEVSYHVKLLHEAGLIEAYDASTLNTFKWYPIRLTWYGHETVDAMRNENIWKETKEQVEKLGSFSFDLLLGIGKQVIMKRLGL